MKKHGSLVFFTMTPPTQTPQNYAQPLGFHILNLYGVHVFSLLLIQLMDPLRRRHAISLLKRPAKGFGRAISGFLGRLVDVCVRSLEERAGKVHT